jgi:hypothetical protein
MSIISPEKTFILNSKHEIPFTENYSNLIATINNLLNSEKFKLFYENENKKKRINSTNFKKFIEKIKNNSNKNINIKALNITNQDDIYNQSEYIFYGDTRNLKINEDCQKKNKGFKEMKRINYIKLRKEIQRDFNKLNDNNNENDNDNNKEDKNKKRILNENNINEEDINNNYVEISNVSHKKKKKGGKKERRRW